MARGEIKLSQIGDYAEEQLEKLLREAVEETDHRVKEATPVDTGRLRFSWQIGENAANGEGASKDGNYRGKPAPPPDAINYRFGKEKLGNVYTVHNNLPYAEPVFTGENLPPSWGGKWRSKTDEFGNAQIQRNYVPHVVAKDMVGYIKSRAAQIGRES